jgi:hypothetical protein
MQIPLRIFGLLFGVYACSVIGANFVSAQSPAPQVNHSEPSHVVVPGELVQTKVFQKPDRDTAVRIPGDGHINSPLIGEVALAAM